MKPTTAALFQLMWPLLTLMFLQGPLDAVAEPSVLDVSSRWDSILDGQTGVTLKSFSGKPIALALVYTSCPAVCPVIVETMKGAETALSGADARFLLVTLDPETDSPARLKAFAAKHGLDSHHWVVLRGSPEDTRELSVALSLKYARAEREQFVHSNTITVVAPSGTIAGRVPGELRATGKLTELLRDGEH